MLRLVHHPLLVLIVFAVVGGPAVHLAQPAVYAAPVVMMADMPCDQMTPGADTSQGTPMMPCKGMTADCLKQMGCVADIALPTRFVALEADSSFAEVGYWSGFRQIVGVARQPEPQPPRTI